MYVSCLSEPGLRVIVTKGYVEPVDTGQAALGLGGREIGDMRHTLQRTVTFSAS